MNVRFASEKLRVSLVGIRINISLAISEKTITLLLAKAIKQEKDMTQAVKMI